MWQSFRNNDSPLDNVDLVGPPPNAQTFANPIIPGTCDQFVADTISADLNNLGRCCGKCPTAP